MMEQENKLGLDASYGAVSANDNRNVYRDWAASYDKDFAGNRGYQFAELIAQAYLDLGGEGPLLDAGCGTGLVAEHLPDSIIVDGVDFSPHMLEIAERKKRYRTLFEADLMKPLAFADETYAGLTCAGTFTQGHVGPEALAELLRVLRPGAICAISGKPPFYETAGFPETFAALIDNNVIMPLTIREERVYRADAAPPEGHENDMAYLITFQKI
ncbi:MAG: class I SAM-dependent methyltransferase [Chloroflexota bacterium]